METVGNQPSPLHTLHMRVGSEINQNLGNTDHVQGWLQYNAHLHGPNSELQSLFVELGEREVLVLHCFAFNAGMYSMDQWSRMFQAL